MRFADPRFFHLLWLLPALCVFLVWARRRRIRDEGRLAARPLLAKLVAGEEGGRPFLKGFLLLVAVFCLVLGLTRIQSEDRMGSVPVKRTGVDIVIAVDTSESMLAEDIKPNRLARARQEIIGLLDRLKGDRVGLVAFSGKGYVLCPLTLDYGAARVFLEELDTDLVTEPGTSLAEAIAAASGAFVEGETEHKALVLMTDGEGHEGDAAAEAKKAAEKGVRIFAIGFGRPDGEPIPVHAADGSVSGFKKDRAGNVVLSRLDEAALQEIALATGGKYYRATAGGSELDRVYDEVSRMEKKEIRSEIFTAYKDWFQIPLAVALAVLSLEFVLGDRRRLRRAWGGRFE